MASKEDEGGCVTLTWEIQNFSLLLPLDMEYCCTPFLRTEHTGNSEWWRLGIMIDDSKIYIILTSNAESLHLDSCEMSLISSCMEVQLKQWYTDSEMWSYTIERDAIFDVKKQSILPSDTRTLRCKMLEKTMMTREFRIHSVLHRFSYHWNIENFHPCEYYCKYFEEEKFLFKAYIQSKSEKGTHAIIIDEVSNIEHYVSPVYCKLSEKNGRLRVIQEINDNTCNTKIYEIEIYLNNTSLDLQLESVFAVHKIYQDPFKLPSPPRSDNVSEEVSGSLGDDILLLYRDKLFADATLNAEGKSFRVHRSILSDRSPVFRAMFEKDEMSEGREGVVDIDDVDSETVDRMLVYLYGDSLRSVQQWEDTSALYYAADKYDIKPLKHKCVTRLKEGLTVDNACEVLALADRHSDDQLMKCIVDFIRQNEEVMSSEKWDNFENCNPLLAAKVLRKIYVKNRKK